MSNLEVFKTIRAFGMAVMRNNGEWKIDYRRDDKRKTHESSYFTTDNDDAVSTARYMSLWRYNDK